MKEYITIRDFGDVKTFVHETGKVIGKAMRDMDGSFYFWFSSKGEGCWSSYLIREIADKLDLLNKDFDDRMAAYVAAELSNT
jgi:hypothetical protein